MSIFCNKILQYLLPDGHFGIAVPGSTYFVIHLTQSPINTFISDQNNSSCVILLLDLVNMLSEVSCQACHNILLFTPSLPLLFDSLIFFIQRNCCHGQKEVDGKRQEAYIEGDKSILMATIAYCSTGKWWTSTTFMPSG
jgi:hypothetical protein